MPDFPAAALGDDESSDGPGVEFGDQRKTGAAVEVDLQLEARVGDSGSEALLVDFPQGVEIFGTEVAQAEAHENIVSSRIRGPGLILKQLCMTPRVRAHEGAFENKRLNA